MSIKKLTIFTFVLLLSLLSLNLISATLNVSLSDQGTGVAYLNGTTLSSGDLSVLIYTTSSGGSPIYNETFVNNITNGSWNVMLGSGSINLPLEFGKVYYKDYLIAGENASFDGSDRQAFYSPLGDISDEDISDSTNLTLGEKITFAFGEIIDNIVDSWIRITGGLNVTGNATVTGTSLTVNGNEVCLADGTNCQAAAEGSNIWINDTDWTYINTTLAPDNVSVNDLNVTGDLYVSNNSIYIGNARLDLARYVISTGVLFGGTLSINAANNSLLNVTSGTAVIANLSNINGPIIGTISWDAQTIYPNLEGVRSKWIGINASGDFVFATAFTALEKRTIVVLGRAWGAGTDTITGKGQYSTPAFGTAKLTEDLVYALGSLNIAGNIFSANGVNLLLNKSSGQSFRFSAGFSSSPTSPNIHDDAEQLGITSYKYHLQGSSTTTTESDIEPDYYDVGGSKTAVTNNKFTVQRIYFFPVSGTVHVTYGQTEYGTLTEATDAAQTEAVILNTDILSGSILRAWMVIEQGTTDLSDSAKVSIITASNIGAGGGGAGGVSTHSSLSNLEWNASGHTFSSAATMDIGSYNFTTTGNVGIGTSGSVVPLHVNLSSNGTVLRLEDSDGTCDHNPETGSEVVSCSSDARLKKNIRVAENILDWIMGFRVKDYEVIASGKQRTGVIAQEVKEIYPELVIGGGDGYLMVEQPNPWKLLKAIQELKEENDLLKYELCVRDNSYSWC